MSCPVLSRAIAPHPCSMHSCIGQALLDTAVVKGPGREALQHEGNCEQRKKQAALSLLVQQAYRPDKLLQHHGFGLDPGELWRYCWHHVTWACQHILTFQQQSDCLPFKIDSI